MIDRVERLPKPDPNIHNLLAVLRRERPERIPFLELKLDDEVMSALLGEPYVPWSKNGPSELRDRSLRQSVGLMHRLGFDAFRLRTAIPFSTFKDQAADTAELNRGQRAWQNEHRGPIQTAEDLDRYPWPTVADIDFGPVEETLRLLPDGMACIGYCSGLFEWSSWLMGLESFMLALYDAPGLIREVVDRVGRLLHDCFEVWCRTDGVPILWMGDDLGYKTNTMISAAHLREYIFPWYRRYVDLAHRYNKPFLLHSCGNLKCVMPELVDPVGIDGKHSFEDVIQPVEEFAREWRGRLAVIGGVDIDILARRDETEIVRRTRQILDACAPPGGYACGSGNSIPNYVPADHFLAMIETVHRFNGRR
ncbi:MAG TPA: uroporphyrinogen decarboxylase family protein [Phycisphaerae bacterium]|nr:uroporphyrinogen decarboxylase family protein [Phycisphaerae bacterium]HRY71117.1 uroporphyrinogen decarboxylase family protein [Phycisphaerae bacterium]HSA29473.1 uroporphyrinogen decarboxylase family protein [Phycisphaerae bacterium]